MWKYYKPPRKLFARPLYTIVITLKIVSYDRKNLAWLYATGGY